MESDHSSSLELSDRDDNLLRLMFTGDVHLGPAYNDKRMFDHEILEACQRSDYVVVNVEGPITDHPPSQIPGAVLHSAPKSAKAIEAFGNNIFNLGNNHILDHGVVGLRDTIQFAKDRGWPCVGAGENVAHASTPCLLERNDITVGIVSVCWLGVPFAKKTSPGVFGDSPESRVRKQIRELKCRVRWVVVVYHGGEEFTHIPQPSRRNKLLRYLSFGADVVVAHHAHCVQRYERVGEKLVFYGLGNLVFDLDYHCDHEGTDESVLLSLSFSKQSIDFHPLFTRQDRSKQLVLKVSGNPNFSHITNRTYSQEWRVDASRHLKAYWNLGHEKTSCNSWKQKRNYLLKKARRVARLLIICAFDKYGLKRPNIIGGVMYHIRNKLRMETCGDTLE